MRKVSRRGFTGWLLALPIWPWYSARVTPAQSPASSSQVRRYRADAVILLLGIPIFRRPGVGEGEASIEETKDGSSTRRTLFFAANSDPKRAHGLNRMGWIREVILESDSTPTEASYFGVITSSPEESLQHARKAIDGPQSSRSLYSAVNGRNTPGLSRSALTRFESASDPGSAGQPLIKEAQATFESKVQWRETSWPDALRQVPPTFLYELARLLKQRTRRASGWYVYNEQEYSLELEAATSDGIVPVRGKIKNRKTGRQTTFVLGIESSPGSIVPVRIEFQPRSYLKLTFEAV